MEQEQDSRAVCRFRAPDEIRSSPQRLDDGACSNDLQEKCSTASNAIEVAREKIQINQSSTKNLSGVCSPVFKFKAGQHVWAQSKHGAGFWPATITKLQCRNHQDDHYATVHWEDRQDYSSEEEMSVSRIIKRVEPVAGREIRCKYLANANAVNLHNQRLESEAILEIFCSTKRLALLVVTVPFYSQVSKPVDDIF